MNRIDHTLTTGTGFWPLRLARGPADRSLVSGSVGSEPDTLSGRRLRHGGDQQYRHLHSTHAHHGSDRECLPVSRLSVCWSVWLSLLPVSVCLSAVCLFVCVAVSAACMFVCLAACLPVRSHSPSVHVACLSVCLTTCVSVCPSVCLPACLLTCLPDCLSV